MPLNDSLGPSPAAAASAGPETIQLLCSLCMTMVNMDDLEKHSKICASGARAAKSSQAAVSATGGALPDAPLDAAWLVRVHPQIEIRFLQPQKHQNLLSSYWSFELATKTKLPQFDREQMSVRRTFADFEWLRDVLSNQCPHLLIPPLLGKSKLLPSLSDEEFAASSQRFLSKFLNDVCFHAELQRVPAFMAFLSCSDAASFAEAKKQAADLVAAANTSRLTLKERAKQAMSSLPGAMSALASGNLSAVSQAAAAADDEEGKAMLQMVADNAAEARTLADLTRQLRDAARDQYRALLVYSAMSGKMSPLVGALGAGKAVEARLAPHASTLANTLLADSASTVVHARRLLLSTLEPIEFWIAKADEAEALCVRLAEARRVMNVLRNAQVKAITSATQSNGAKQSAALESLIQRRVEAEMWVQRHEAAIRQELTQFDDSRAREFKRIMFLLALHQATAHREQAGVWHGSVARLN
jgi:hypothetical protein